MVVVPVPVVVPVEVVVVVVAGGTAGEENGSIERLHEPSVGEAQKRLLRGKQIQRPGAHLSNEFFLNPILNICSVNIGLEICERSQLS